jgi:two-component system sensor histidine kinase KdpD
MRRLSLSARLLLAILVAALLPLLLLALILAAVEPILTGSTFLVALLITATVAVVAAVLAAPSVAHGLLGPLGDLARTLQQLHVGDLDARLPVESDDELGRLAESHNRLAATLAARNRSLGLVSRAVAAFSPRDGVAALVPAAEAAARDAFGFTAAHVALGAEDLLPPPSERVPGEAYEVRVPLAVGDDHVGTLIATQVPTRAWGPADDDLLRIFGVQLAAAIRNAELFAAAADLAELKNEFLRGVSHNLQTPLTSIRAFAGQLATESSDGRLGIIVEQTDRLSRLVAQLLTVSRLEAGTLRPEIDVFAVGPLVRRAWESLGKTEHPFSLHDGAAGWLAAADRDWVEQVVWALLDNALRYGGDGPIEVSIEQRADETGSRVVTVVRDRGPGIPTDQRERAFERFTRLAPTATEGSGLGLSVARGLIETMGGRLELTDVPGPGAAFAFSLPAERIEAP